jgi:hypothetical protein
MMGAGMMIAGMMGRYNMYRLIILLLAALVLAGCGRPGYQDGTYSGRSGTDDDGA